MITTGHLPRPLYHVAQTLSLPRPDSSGRALEHAGRHECRHECLRYMAHAANVKLFPRGSYAEGGRYLLAAAFFMAAWPSPTVMSGVVFTDSHAPPAATAMANAAMLMLSGI